LPWSFRACVRVQIVRSRASLVAVGCSALAVAANDCSTAAACLLWPERICWLVFHGEHVGVFRHGLAGCLASVMLRLAGHAGGCQ
jgi:hypothetical protein